MTGRKSNRPYLVCIGVATSLLACSSSDPGATNTGATMGDGGTTASGGNTVVSTGGTASGKGGASAVTGGTTSVGNGGTNQNGGAQATGGANATGGAPAQAGNATTGGSAATGGANATGGTKATGGATTVGGNVATGGAKATGGTSAGAGTTTGGATSTGGAVATGGKATGGNVATGGVAATGGASTCTEPPAPSTLVGWASVSGTIGSTTVATTTGGGNATPVTVTTLAELQNAVKGTSAAVIYVKGVLAAGSIAIGSNKTIAGICGAEIHGHLGLSGSSNVIVRNIKIVGNNCTDSPSECSSGADAVTIVSSAHHIWFDHCDISDGSDGNLDITNGSDFVTVSYTKFSYSSKRTDPVAGASGHRFSNLIGAGDAVAEDVGHLNVTYHHCWWAQNVDQRMPRTRRGKIHVFNNLFTATGNSYCTNAGFEASLLVQNNVYVGVKNPLSPDANATGMTATGNLFTNTTGTTTAPGGGFTPTYTYTLDTTSGLQATLQAAVGPH